MEGLNLVYKHISWRREPQG
uniref:Uncharacterized protein n=1 Tax=Arundo donax TaxID=35708 RepID=A0A0A8YFH6_ARUDO